jgi:hypothetical protein
MEILSQIFKNHPYIVPLLMLVSSAGTWLFNNVVTTMVAELPAPGDKSTEKYRYWFRVANKFVGNKQRAENTSIENSPNFLPAVQKLLAVYGLQLPTPLPQAPSAPPTP